MSSAYTRIYARLIHAGMTPSEVASELAELRKEIGVELSAGLREHIRQVCRYGPSDTQGRRRILARQFGAMNRAADWIAAAVATGRLTTTPHQRNNRSNP
ncbi:hypothetical protein ACFWZZ_00455 [[Kitasatospora] papulosa]|uniref:hypothetical protein n=1 Tax=Streptomyces TaxID=1883 RepID=UPI00332F0C04